MAAAVAERQEKRRKAKPNNSSKSTKPTRRIYMGWKLKVASGCFIQQSLSAGGGTHTMDIEKQATLQHVTQKFKDLFFPNGIAPTRGLHIDDATQVYVATFQGKVVVEDDFPLEKYIKNNTNPARLYLHTIFVNRRQHTCPYCT